MPKKLAVFIFCVTMWNYCSACTCVTKEFEAAIESADEIFLGKVIKSEILEYSNSRDLILTKITFRIVEKWKGTNQEQIELLIGGNSCDSYFNNQNRDYLVYANNKFYGWRFKDIGSIRSLGQMTPEACSRTTEINITNIEEIKSEILLLNKHFPSRIKLNDRNGFPYYNIVSFLGIILIVFLIMYSVNRKKKDYH